MSAELKTVFYTFCGQGMGASKAAETTDIDSAKFAKLVRYLLFSCWSPCSNTHRTLSESPVL